MPSYTAHSDFTQTNEIRQPLCTARVTVKPEFGFYLKRWEERQVPAPAELIAELQKHTRRPNCLFAFPSPAGNREQHILDRCKAVAKRAASIQRSSISRPFALRTRPGCSARVSMCHGTQESATPRDGRLPTCKNGC